MKSIFLARPWSMTKSIALRFLFSIQCFQCKRYYIIRPKWIIISLSFHSVSLHHKFLRERKYYSITSALSDSNHQIFYLIFLRISLGDTMFDTVKPLNNGIGIISGQALSLLNVRLSAIETLCCWNLFIASTICPLSIRIKRKRNKRNVRFWW